MAKKRTVTKTKAADGSKSKVVTRKMKDGTTKVKSKTKSGGVVTKRKVTVGPKKTTRKIAFLEPIGDRRSGAKSISGETKKTTQSEEVKSEPDSLHGDYHIIKKSKDKKNISVDETRDFIHVNDVLDLFQEVTKTAKSFPHNKLLKGCIMTTRL